MKSINMLLGALMCLVLCTSCKKTETVVDFGFVCSDNLFEFVEITAVYTTSTGEESTTVLTPQNMNASEESFSTGESADISSTTSTEILEWRQSKTYDDKVDAHLTVSFRKKPGVNYSSYNDKIIKITTHAYLNSRQSENGLGSVTQNTSIEVVVNTEPVIIYGGKSLEEYIDKLVAKPITK